MLFIFGVYLDFCVDLPLYVNLCQGGGGGGGGARDWQQWGLHPFGFGPT